MRTACLLLLLVTGLAAATPLPFPGLQAHGDNALPSAAGLSGKLQVWLIVDWAHYDDTSRKHPGRDAYWSAHWHFRQWRTGDQKLFAIVIASNGQLPARKSEETDYHAKAQDGGGGLVRALGGATATAVLITVDRDGRLRSLHRHAGDFNPLRQELDKLISDTQRPLIAGAAEVPPAAAPAALLLKLGDARGAVALAMRKLGRDGHAFAGLLGERAAARIAEEADLIGNPAQPPTHRFLALRRLEGLLAEFPTAPTSAAASEAIKRVRKDDAAVQTEAQAWSALEQYLTQAARQPPSKLAAFQAQTLMAIRERFANTEAARLAGLIMSAAKIELPPPAP